MVATRNSTIFAQKANPWSKMISGGLHWEFTDHHHLLTPGVSPLYVSLESDIDNVAVQAHVEDRMHPEIQDPRDDPL